MEASWQNHSSLGPFFTNRQKNTHPHTRASTLTEKRVWRSENKKKTWQEVWEAYFPKRKIVRLAEARADNWERLIHVELMMRERRALLKWGITQMKTFTPKWVFLSSVEIDGCWRRTFVSKCGSLFLYPQNGGLWAEIILAGYSRIINS